MLMGCIAIAIFVWRKRVHIHIPPDVVNQLLLRLLRDLLSLIRMTRLSGHGMVDYNNHDSTHCAED
jgi:hypothetical protein